MPLQLMSTTSHRLFHEGPKRRRQFLDWLLFHVEPSFLNLWQMHQRTLKQRNAALKNKQSRPAVLAWDAQLCALSDEIDHHRAQILEEIKPTLFLMLEKLLPECALTLTYSRGWPADQTLQACLNDGFSRDRALNYTYYGPQRADFQLLCQDVPIQDHLSQGQQKLAAYALALSQGQFIKYRIKRAPIYLIDDLPSELDPEKSEILLGTLKALDAQVFITSITSAPLESLTTPVDSQLFHVKEGDITPIAS